MTRAIYSRLVAIAVAGVFLAGCAANKMKKEDESGYLGDAASYADLTETKDPKGNVLYRVVNPKLTPANYNAVLLEPLEYFPKPTPTEQVTEETLKQIGAYINEALRRSIGEKVMLADKPGPGVVRIKSAITAMIPEKEGLAPYHFVPVAFVVTMGSRAVTGIPENARMVIETKGTDSVSGETLIKVVRAGTGETLKKVKEQRVVTLEAIKPLIDEWAEGDSAEIPKYVKAK